MASFDQKLRTDRRTIYTEMEILDKFGLDIQQKKGKCPRIIMMINKNRLSQQLQVCRDDNRFFYEYSWVKLKAYRRYFLKLWTMSEISAKIAYEKL